LFLPSIKDIDFVVDELALDFPEYQKIKEDLPIKHTTSLTPENDDVFYDVFHYSRFNNTLRLKYCSHKCFKKHYKLAQQEAKKHVYKQKKTKFNDEKLPMSVIRNKLKEKYGQCRICGDDRALEVHHIIPKEYGGKDTLSNTILLCPTCHNLAHGKGVTSTG
jgi:5-methylcytosine-specific restriction endonuclease McrA